ncbi:MAG: RpiB/LacA/LacB family sugar-phosphate isomerase [Candidatus Paceibacterota bacterium]
MKIYIGADHRGFELKNKLKDWLQTQDHEVIDCGNDHLDPQDDYTDFARAVAEKVQLAQGLPGGGEDSPGVADEISRTSSGLGILICGSGVGVSIVANRFRGVRCGLGFNKNQIKHARENDHINCLALAADYIDTQTAQEMTKTFLSAIPKRQEKYLRRIRKIDQN